MMTIVLYSLIEMLRVKLFGIRINISFVSVLLISFGLVTSVRGQRLVLFSLISAAIHELGHIFLISFLKEKPLSIYIGVYEFKINCDLSCCSFREDILITSAGIMFNFGTAFVLWILSVPVSVQWMNELSLCNLCIGIINMLPLQSLDGGQLLTLVLSRFFKEKTVNFLLTIITIMFIFPLLFAGVYLLFTTKYNYSLFFVATYLLIIVVSKYI